ncbi:MAG: hypothetical protein E7604_03765 [Ruminococcaceae bacterium]|nr:hypothetical protein [Oscillospiraceae bacterium]
MKTTKRILAMITALVLCLAPMALMVGAAATGTLCHECGKYTVVTTYPNTPMGPQVIIGSANVCYEQEILTELTKCTSCHTVYYDETTTRKYNHVNFAQNSANGRYYCVVCGIQKPL